MSPHLALAAPAAPVTGVSGMQIAGTITVSGLALCVGFAFAVGLRGSDRIKIHNKDRALIWGVLTGSIWIAAGGMWADMATGIGDISKGVAGEGSPFGNPGLGGLAAFLTLCAWGPKWKRMIWPGLFGLAAGVIYGQAGGLFGIVVNIIRMIVAKVTGQ